MTSHLVRHLGIAIGLALAGASLTAPVAVAGQRGTVSSTPSRGATFNGAVRAIAVVGNTVYVGGDFTRARDASGTVVRRHLAALNAATGQLRRWNPGADGSVHALAADERRVYVGGEFEHIAGKERRHLAAVSQAKRANAVSRWRNDAVNGYVRALAVTPRGLVVGGSFTVLSGAPRSRLGLIRPNGRLDRTWRPGTDDNVLAIEPRRRRVYIGGVFDAVNGRAGTAT